MSAAKRNTDTPIPTDFMGLTKAVVRIEEGVTTIREDLLPPVAEAAGQARDGVIKLEGWSKDLSRRVKALEGAPPPPHECSQDDRLDAHDRKITGQEKEISGLSKWRTWLAAIAIPVVITLGGAAGKAINDSATTRAAVNTNTKAITTLSEARERDRDAIIQEVKAVPAKVQQVATEADDERSLRESQDPPLSEIKEQMTERQRRRLEAILREAGLDE